MADESVTVPMPSGCFDADCDFTIRVDADDTVEGPGHDPPDTQWQRACSSVPDDVTQVIDGALYQCNSCLDKSLICYRQGVDGHLTPAEHSDG